MDKISRCPVCGQYFTSPGWYCSGQCEYKAGGAKPRTRKHKTKFNYGKEWPATRAAVLSRDGHKCVKCGSTSCLAVHHLDGVKANMGLENLITLCHSCHFQTHSPW